ncbi:vancomycin resistance histidine kinase VanS [Paenibacillus sp. CCS19]|uniref:sensor histidine kinase n=1 Tax=Paenibacillus sp. CCS19 TaxID=3158387 RepID=UPI0025611B68|nr:HAMP domain-containing sensor histidine kinase [Paenibacillus cellulosilyticus]GMK40644.1 vancomycin resistance histidine kinase VanS [Paenibacillus cellulosilyticus]
MDNIFRSFRARMLLLFGLSMMFSGLVTYVIYKILQSYYNDKVRYPGDATVFYRQLIGHIGDFNFFLIVFIPLAIMFFFLLTKRYATYFRTISDGIRSLAVGDFNNRIMLNSGDEFETIADDINLASEQLKKAIERGDFAESSKDQLVLNLAHDLRTPLTSVLGYLDLLLTNEQLTPEQARHYTSIAFTKSRRLEKLIEELFEITRMNYGMLSIDKHAIDLGELLSQLTDEMYPVFEKNKLTARLNVLPNTVIKGDGELLARVFENLMSNAARYGKDGQFVDISCSLEGSEAIVQVVNYGQIIPEHELPHLFDMFYTGDQARTHQEGSTGLGLFIARNIVKQHGGTITAESSWVRTAFEVRLPRQG